MEVTVFGATGAIGRKVVAELLIAGHVVRAFTRDPAKVPPDPRVIPVVGDLTDTSSIRDAVAGAGAIVWAVGATSNSADQPPMFEAAARAVVGAMHDAGVRRLVALSGAGITIEGERKALGGRLMTAIVGVLARHVVDAKRREYEVFRHSGLDWSLVRPPRVVAGPASDAYRAGPSLQGTRVTDGSLARFMASLAEDRTYLGAAPFVSD